MCAHCGGTAGKQDQRGFGSVCEEGLPLCVQDLLLGARASRPASEITCVAFRTFDGSDDIARIGPSPQVMRDWGNPGQGTDRLRPKEVLVLSVTATETTFERVRKVTHVLVARISAKQPWLMNYS